MPNAQLLAYIAQRKLTGLADNLIQDELMKASWPMAEVISAFGGEPPYLRLRRLQTPARRHRPYP